MDKKVLYLICEGKTDSLTLYKPLINLFKKYFPNIEVKVTHGDIAYKDTCNENNVHEMLENYITDYLATFGLHSGEVVAVVQLIDTDGAFCDPAFIKRKEEIGPYEFRNDGIYVDDIDNVKNRFTKKTKIYKKILQIDEILRIPFIKLFVSRNLEHAFYNEINLDDEEKTKRAFDFSSSYKDDDEKFEEFLESIKFSCPDDYEKSWDFILKDNNSIKRCSNLFLLFGEVKKIIDANSEEAKIERLKHM